MQKFVGFARKSTGTLMTAGTGTFAVYQPGTTTPVTVYTGDSTATAVSSFTIPVTGKIEFYARNGDIKVVATEGAETVTVDDVTMNAGTTYGTFAARPAAGSADRRYVATDTGREYYDDGSAWNLVNSNTLTKITPAELATASICAGMNMVNGTLVASVASSALTIAIKTLAGTDPSATDPVIVQFRNATAATGDMTTVSLTAATSVVVSNGSSLGVGANNSAFRIWIVGFNDTSNTFRLGVINCLSTSAGAGSGRNADGIYPLGQFAIASSTAEGGAGAADSAQVFYTGTAVTSKPYVVLGSATYETGLAAAGVWSAVPTRLSVYRLGMALPGERVQFQRNPAGTVATGTTVVPFDNTIPQNTEGDQYMTQAVTPSSAANVLEIEAAMTASHSVNTEVAMALFQDTTANALTARMFATSNTASMGSGQVTHRMLAATSSATTFKVRAGGQSAGTTTFNGQGSGGKYGGVINSYMRIEEIMA